MKVQGFLFLVIMILSSCSVNNWDIERYENKFVVHKQDFEVLITLLKAQDIKVGYSINENELPENIKIIIDKLKISNINIRFTQCKDLLEYEFTSLWCSKATLYFSKDTCQLEKTIKSYHTKESEMIEVWGMGDGWTM